MANARKERELEDTTGHCAERKRMKVSPKFRGGVMTLGGAVFASA